MIAQMIRATRDRERADEEAFAREFEAWWTGRQRATRYAEIARDLRNDAAHDVYEKAPDGPRWRMRIGNRQPVPLDDFTDGYLRANLNRFFSFGGYGSDSTERVELTRRALERAHTVSGGAIAAAECIAVGDTPSDVIAAHGAEIRVVGVATGKFGLNELQSAGADFALSTLEEGFPA